MARWNWWETHYARPKVRRWVLYLALAAFLLLGAKYFYKLEFARNLADCEDALFVALTTDLINGLFALGTAGNEGLSALLTIFLLDWGMAPYTVTTRTEFGVISFKVYLH